IITHYPTRYPHRAWTAPSPTYPARAPGDELLALTILQHWNDTIVHLPPAPIVARVRTSWLEDDAENTFEREVSVAAYAAARAAPLVPPTAKPPAGPHRCEGLVVTFWEYVE